MVVVQMNDTSYKNGALKEAHCTTNKQIEGKNTETLTRYHKKRQGRMGMGREGGAASIGQPKGVLPPGPGEGRSPAAPRPTTYHGPTPIPSTWAFK